jgi:lipopolysaccharide export system protein LptA
VTVALFSPAALWPQVQKPPVTITADSLVNTITDGKEKTILIGNVRFAQDAMRGSADKATQLKDDNILILEGNVEIMQDVMLIKAPRLEYNSVTGDAKAEMGVFLSDRDASVTARKGYYNLNTQKADFYGLVKAQQEQTFIDADTINYYRTTQMMYANGNVNVRNESGTLRSAHLTYIKFLGQMTADSNVIVKNDTTLLRCRHFEDDKQTGITKAIGDAAVYDRINSTWILADTIIRQRESSQLLAFGKPFLMMLDTAKRRDSTVIEELRIDTLFIKAVSMKAITDSASRKVFAYDSVRTLRNDFAATGDTMIYVRAESKMYLRGTHRQRIWNEETELGCDSMVITLDGNKLRQADAYGKPFLTSPYTDGDKPGRMHQLHSQEMSLYFREDSLRTLWARYNAMSLYFVTSDEKPSGVNRSSGDSMRIDFSLNKPNRITVLGGTEGEFIPEHYVGDRGSAFRLSAYERHREEKPTRGDFPDVILTSDELFR